MTCQWPKSSFLKEKIQKTAVSACHPCSVVKQLLKYLILCEPGNENRPKSYVGLKSEPEQCRSNKKRDSLGTGEWNERKIPWNGKRCFSLDTNCVKSVRIRNYSGSHFPLGTHCVNSVRIRNYSGSHFPLDTHCVKCVRIRNYSGSHFPLGTHCVKSVRIRNYSGSHFPAFRLNTERYSVFSPNGEKYGPE